MKHIIWLLHPVVGYPHLYPGWNFVTDAEKTVLESNNFSGPGFDDERRRVHLKRVAPQSPA